MQGHPFAYVLPLALLLLAVAFLINERRMAARAGRRPRTLLFVLCVIAGALAVVVAATLVLASA